MFKLIGKLKDRQLTPQGRESLRLVSALLIGASLSLGIHLTVTGVRDLTGLRVAPASGWEAIASGLLMLTMSGICVWLVRKIGTMPTPETQAETPAEHGAA